MSLSGALGNATAAVSSAVADCGNGNAFKCALDVTGAAVDLTKAVVFIAAATKDC